MTSKISKDTGQQIPKFLSWNFHVVFQNLISFAQALWENLANYNFKSSELKLQFFREKDQLSDSCFQGGNFWPLRLSKHALIMVELCNGVWFLVEAANHSEEFQVKHYFFDYFGSFPNTQTDFGESHIKTYNIDIIT